MESPMTQLLEKALSEVAKLPPPEQDALAAILLHELASEQRWSESFAKSQDVLAKLAEEALVEYAAGKLSPCKAGAISHHRIVAKFPDGSVRISTFAEREGVQG